MYEYNALITRVVDGDTYDADIDLGFKLVIGDVRLRLRGVDTPETWRPTTEAEREHGERATTFVKELIENQTVTVRTYKAGIFNRYEADVIVDTDHGPMDLAVILSANGFEKLDTYPEDIK